MTNEERAHDIALASAELTLKFQVEAALHNGAAEVNVDFYAVYKEAYKLALEEVNKDFK